MGRHRYINSRPRDRQVATPTENIYCRNKNICQIKRVKNLLRNKCKNFNLAPTAITLQSYMCCKINAERFFRQLHLLLNRNYFYVYSIFITNTHSQFSKR